MSSNDASLELMRAASSVVERPVIGASLEESHGNLSQWCAASAITVEEFGRLTGVTMWPPYGTMPDEIPLVGAHEDIDDLELPELRRPAEDAPLAMLLVHLVGLWAGRLRRVLAWGSERLNQRALPPEQSGVRLPPPEEGGGRPWEIGRGEGRRDSGDKAGQQSRALWTSVATAKRAAAQAQTGRRRD